MGRKSRLKKLRTKLTDKLKEIGLEDQIYFVVSKEFKYRKPVLDEKGKPVLDEKGEMKTTIEDARMYSAKNPLRQLYRKLMKEDEATIKNFINSFNANKPTPSQPLPIAAPVSPEVTEIKE